MSDLNLSRTGRPEGSIVSVKQEHEEVKWCCLLWNYLLFSSCVTFIVLHFVFYACPQLVNDMNDKLSENNGFRNDDMKQECSPKFSNYSSNEGNPDFSLGSVLYWVHYNAYILSYHFIHSFDFHITGSSASEPVLDIEDIIDLKDEPVEVSLHFMSMCASINLRSWNFVSMCARNN